MTKTAGPVAGVTGEPCIVEQLDLSGGLRGLMKARKNIYCRDVSAEQRHARPVRRIGLGGTVGNSVAMDIVLFVPRRSHAPPKMNRGRPHGAPLDI